MGAPPFVADARHDRHYGDIFTWHDETTGPQTDPVLLRKIPGPDGFLATRHGAGGPWVFTFGEARGTRFLVDDGGAFVQDVNYQPFGKPSSTGAQPGSPLHGNEQWNYGDYLAAFGISKLGARFYDPAIGRFLSRDPLLIPRTAATTNPYAFAINDPVNHSDPTGLDPIDEEKPSTALKSEGGTCCIYGGERSGGQPGDLYDPAITWTSGEPGYQGWSDSSSGSHGRGSSGSGGQGTSLLVSTGGILASQPTTPVVQSLSWTFLPDNNSGISGYTTGYSESRNNILDGASGYPASSAAVRIQARSPTRPVAVGIGVGVVVGLAVVAWWILPEVLAAGGAAASTQADKIEEGVAAVESAGPAVENAAISVVERAVTMANGSIRQGVEAANQLRLSQPQTIAAITASHNQQIGTLGRSSTPLTERRSSRLAQEELASRSFRLRRMASPALGLLQ